MSDELAPAIGTSSYLPIIDLAPSLFEPDAERRVAADIDTVCRQSGFFYIVGHGVPQDLIQTVFSSASQFFSQPIQVKRQYGADTSVLRRGWSPVGHQQLASGQPVDIMEAFSVGLENDPAEPSDEGASRRGPNPWPEEAVAPGLRCAAESYMQALDRVARHVMRLIAIGLRLPGDYFEPFMRQPSPSLRLLHYPPHPAGAPTGQAGAGAHTDWGALTLLAQDDCGGLQVQDTQGVWRDVPPVPNSFVVNLGDLMSRWTNDSYRSTVHRVINNVSGRDRYSIPYFFNIDSDARVSALPGCHGPTHPRRYSDITAGEHHLEKMRAARGHT